MFGKVMITWTWMTTTPPSFHGNSYKICHFLLQISKQFCLLPSVALNPTQHQVSLMFNGIWRWAALPPVPKYLFAALSMGSFVSTSLKRQPSLWRIHLHLLNCFRSRQHFCWKEISDCYEIWLQESGFTIHPIQKSPWILPTLFLRNWSNTVVK